MGDKTPEATPEAEEAESADRLSGPGGAVDADACVGRLRRSLTHL